MQTMISGQKNFKNAHSESPNNNIDPCFTGPREDCEEVAGNPQIKFIVLPQYGNCTARVEYKLWKCTDVTASPPKISYVFSQFSAVPLQTPNCQDILDEWWYFENYWMLDSLNASLDAFFLTARAQTEFKFIESQILLDPLNYICGINSTLTTEFYTLACYQWCVTHPTPSSIETVQLACGDKCCKRETQWCWDDVFQQVRPFSTPSVTSFGGCNTTTYLPCNGTPVGPCDSPGICQP